MTIILYKLVQFFLILMLGYGLARGGVLPESSLAVLSRLVTRVLLPIFTFCSMYSGNTRQQLIDGLPILLLTAVFYLVLGGLLAVLSGMLKLTGARRRVFQALFLFGNTGFVGFPILQSLYGGQGVLYIALFSVVDQAILWSYGLFLCSGGGFRPKNLLNPCICAILLAVVLLLTKVSVPPILMDAAASVGNANTGICMLYLGALLCYSNLKTVLKRRELYIGMAVKMLLLPVCLGLLLPHLLKDTIMCSALILISALPTMTVIPILAKEGGEGEYAAGVTMVTLLASLVTLPLIAFLAL